MTLHRVIFQGRFVDEAQPHRVLQRGLTLCKLTKIESQIPLIDQQTDAARREGRDDEARELIQRRLELRKEQATLQALLREDEDTP